MVKEFSGKESKTPRGSLRSLRVSSPVLHQQIDQVLWHWARVLDDRSRFGTRCGTVPLWGPSGYWGAGAGIRKLPTLDNGLRNFDATLRSNPPAPPGTSYSRAQRSSFQNAGTPTPPFRVVPSRPQVLTVLEARSVCASCFTLSHIGTA